MPEYTLSGILAFLDSFLSPNRINCGGYALCATGGGLLLTRTAWRLRFRHQQCLCRRWSHVEEPPAEAEPAHASRQVS